MLSLLPHRLCSLSSLLLPALTSTLFYCSRIHHGVSQILIFLCFCQQTLERIWNVLSSRFSSSSDNTVTLHWRTNQHEIRWTGEHLKSSITKTIKSDLRIFGPRLVKVSYHKGGRHKLLKVGICNKVDSTLYWLHAIFFKNTEFLLRTCKIRRSKSCKSRFTARCRVNHRALYREQVISGTASVCFVWCSPKMSFCHLGTVSDVFFTSPLV